MSDEEPEVVIEVPTKAKPVKMNYPGNQKKSRPEAVPEKKVIAKVVQSEPITRKKPLGRKIAETFTGDSAQEVGTYVLFDIVIPAIKGLIVDSGKEALERIFFGGGGGRSRPGAGRPQRGGRTSYQAYYSSNPPNFEERRPGPQRSLSQKARATHDFDEIVLETRGEAEAVLDGLGFVLEQYDVVTVSDLYDLVGLSGSYTDDKWGWYDLKGSSIARVRDGYLLNLPKTSVVD